MTDWFERVLLSLEDEQLRNLQKLIASVIEKISASEQDDELRVTVAFQ